MRRLRGPRFKGAGTRIIVDAVARRSSSVYALNHAFRSANPLALVGRASSSSSSDDFDGWDDDEDEEEEGDDDTDEEGDGDVYDWTVMDTGGERDRWS